MNRLYGIRSGGYREFPFREPFLDGIEGIHLVMLGRGGYIYQGTR